MNSNAVRPAKNAATGKRFLRGALALMLLSMASAHASGIFRVDAASMAATPDGQSWANAHKTLQAGVDAANAAGGGEVWVKAGAYTATADPVVTMRQEVALYGGFAGTEVFRSERNVSANISRIDGENARRCVVGADNATLDGFTVTRGLSNVSGGGMYNASCSPTVENCIFTANTADNDDAGGISHGGGMYNFSASPTVASCSFSGNMASGTNGVGGGMYNSSSSSPTVSYCSFSGNTASGVGAGSSAGGGMYNSSSSSPTLMSCSFSGNTASAGGGMYNDSSAPTLTKCFFSANTASYGATESGNGGGICNLSSSPTLTNSSFVGNTAARGGAMYNGSSTPAMMNCTFTLNKANTGGSLGGAMYNSLSTPTVTNCILWGDTATNDPEIYDSSSTPTVTYSCVQGGRTGTGNISANPLFVNAPITVRLQDSSPCINTGTAGGAPYSDIRGVPRPQGAGVDMGIYEMVPAAAPPVIIACAPGRTVSQDASCQALVPDFSAGVIAVDDHDSSLTVTQLPAAGTAAVKGDTVVTLTVTNDAGRFAACTALLTVADTTPPIITLNGASLVVLECGGTYADAGAEAADNCVAGLAVTAVGDAVNTAAVGVHTVTYNANDGNGNHAAQVTRIVEVADTTRPFIALLGSAAVTVECGATYIDAGATASDACAGSLTGSMQITNPVNINMPGVYTVRYGVNDGSGNSAAEVTRTVSVVDTARPIITRSGSDTVTAECGAPYVDPGATAADACTGDLTGSIAVTNPVNMTEPGVYTVRYNVNDGSGNSAAELTRLVSVVDTARPFIARAGQPAVVAECHTFYVDAGAVASDACAGSLTGSMQITNPVNINMPGTYTMRYNVNDGHGNSAVEATRLVHVMDTTRPVITRLGSAVVAAECHMPYTDAGATAGDACAGNLSASIAITNPVDVNTLGTYTVRYNVNDGNSATNNATEVIRTVNVVDTTPPVITLLGAATATVECRASYTDAGATASDACTGDLTASIAVTNPVDVNAPGTYTVRYNVNDASGNSAAERTRTVTVADSTPPVIILLGATPVTVECGASHTDAGATASDSCAGNLSASIVVTNPADANTPGTYTVRYNVKDGSGNSAAEVTRTVTVADSTPPVITLLGPASVTLDCGQTYTDAGATALDGCSGGLTGSIVTAGLPPSEPLSPGHWTVTCNVRDGAGNAAASVSRMVTVRDNCTLAVTAAGDTLIPITVGGRVELALAVTGAVGGVSYQWSAESTFQGGKVFNILPGADSAILVIDPVATDAEGLYRCAVSDAVTTVNSPIFTLAPPAEPMPAAGPFGLATAAVALGLGGIFIMRRRRR